MTLVTPRTPPGVMELLPRQQIAFQRMLDVIRDGFERFAFQPIETPVFETLEVLLTKSGGETEKQVYFVQSTGALQQGRPPELGLRFDLTVPLARYVAEHERQLSFPFRRYQIQRVYRGERAQKGRYREFYQCDIDVIGKDRLPLLYDAELPAVIHHVFERLGFGDFTINLNNRLVLLGLVADLGVADGEPCRAVLRELDRLDKIGRDGVADRLASGDFGLDADAVGRLLDLIAGAPGDDPAARDADAVLARLAALEIAHPAFAEGRQALAEVVAGLRALGVPGPRWRINLAIARGLDYYTGTVYETFLDAHPGLGSICSGGRYDDLAGQYSRSRLPGVGVSIGATRLFSQLLDAGLVTAAGQDLTVLVTQIDDDLAPSYLALAARLRAAGIRTELVFEGGKLGRQLKYADRAGIGWAVMMGRDEQARGCVVVRALATGDQDEVALDDLVDHLGARGLGHGRGRGAGGTPL